jgi:hypothetical protein
VARSDERRAPPVIQTDASERLARYAAGPIYIGGLNRSTQHFILEGKDGVWDGTEISSRFYSGGEE